MEGLWQHNDPGIPVSWPNKTVNRSNHSRGNSNHSLLFVPGCGRHSCNLMASFAKKLVILGMFAVASFFSLVAIITLLLPADPNAKDQLSLTLIRTGAATFLFVLAYIAFLFGNRLRVGRVNEDGTYLPPWTFGFIGVVVGCGAIGQIIVAKNWNLVTPSISAILLLLGVPYAAYQRRRLDQRAKDREMFGHHD